MTKYERFHSGEWSGLYVDGKLVKYGDHYIVDEYLSSLLGVEDYYDDDSWLEEGDKPLQTIEEVERAQDRRSEAEEEAAMKVAQANALMEQAKEILKGVGL